MIFGWFFSVLLLIMVVLVQIYYILFWVGTETSLTLSQLASTVTTPLLSNIIRKAAIRLPTRMAGKAHLSLTSSKAAIRLPLQTPVPGKGMATKIIRPKAPYF